MVSVGAKIALGMACTAAAAIVAMVHQMQTADRKRLKEGVIRDLERQERKKRNVRELEEQIELRKKLEHRDRELTGERSENV